MSFCYGFGCKKSSCHSICSFLSRGNSIKKRHPRRVSKTFCTNPSSLGYTAGIGTVCDKNANRLPGFTGPVPPPLLIRYKVCRQCHTKYAALLLFLLYMIPPGLSIGNFDIFCKYKKALQPLQPQRLFYLRRSFQKTTSIMRSDRKSPAEP